MAAVEWTNRGKEDNEGNSGGGGGTGSQEEENEDRWKLASLPYGSRNASEAPLECVKSPESRAKKCTVCRKSHGVRLFLVCMALNSNQVEKACGDPLQASCVCEAMTMSLWAGRPAAFFGSDRKMKTLT